MKQAIGWAAIAFIAFYAASGFVLSMTLIAFAAGVAIIDPLANGPSAVTCFLDPFEAVEFLQFKRRKAAA